MEQKKTIKQYGLQRSGTNYTKFLLEKNYNVNILVNEHGWKHGYYRVTSNELDLIVTIKNPFAWIVSIHKYAYPEIKRPISEFIKREYKFERMRSKSPLHHWNTLNKHWSELLLLKHKTITIRYEDLLEIPEETCHIIANELNFKKLYKFYIPNKKISANAKEYNEEFNRKYYLNKEYMKEFKKEDIEYMYKHLDKDLMDRFYGD